MVFVFWASCTWRDVDKWLSEERATFASLLRLFLWFFFFSFQSLLDEPNPNSPANSLAAQLYQENRREYEKRVQAIVEQSWVGFGEEEEGKDEKKTWNNLSGVKTRKLFCFFACFNFPVQISCFGYLAKTRAFLVRINTGIFVMFRGDPPPLSSCQYYLCFDENISVLVFCLSQEMRCERDRKIDQAGSKDSFFSIGTLRSAVNADILSWCLYMRISQLCKDSSAYVGISDKKYCVRRRPADILLLSCFLQVALHAVFSATDCWVLRSGNATLWIERAIQSFWQLNAV